MKKKQFRYYPNKTERAGEHESEDIKLQEAFQKADSGQPQAALNMLRKLSDLSEAVRNARGVCLLRMKHYEEASRLLRGLVLPTGCTWMKRDLPVIYRANYCLALFLSGHPVGCADCLAEITEQKHPSVIRLHQMLDRWKQSLSWWNRLKWKLGMEPDVSLELDFIPGDFVDVPPEPPRKFPRDPAMPQAA